MSTAALPGHVALVSNTVQLSPSKLTHIAAALQTQAIQHVAPEWHHPATVVAYPDARHVPVAAWVMTVKDHIDAPGAAAYHTDDAGQPYSLIEYSPDFDELSLTLSHELIEMLVDPFGSRLVRMPSPDSSGKLVRVLVEPCDPCEARQFAYRIGDVLVSDFTRHPFYRTHPNGLPCSYTGALKHPGQVLDGGYISWEDPHDHHWHQLTNFGGEQIADLGPYDKASGMSLREWVDAHPDGAGQRGRETLKA